MSMYPRPTEPHLDQLGFEWPASTDGWEPCANTELAPISWSSPPTQSMNPYPGSREPNGTHMLPSELLAYELELTLFDAQFHPPWSKSPTRPAEPHLDQLDPDSWPAVSEWAPVGFGGESGDYGAPHSYGLVPPEWLMDDSGYDTGGGYLLMLKPGYMTAGELYLWQKLNPESEPEPEPEPEPSHELVPAVLAFAGLPADSETVAELVEQHLPIVTAQVRSYTRGRGFTEAGADANLRAVIVSATARSVANPTGSGTLRLGNATYNPGIYAGWTLPELAILHGYRRRSA